MAPRLKERYASEIQPELMREFNYSNVMQAPRVTKVTINIGLGEAKAEPGVPSADQRLVAVVGEQMKAQPRRGTRQGFTRPVESVAGRARDSNRDFVRHDGFPALWPREERQLCELTQTEKKRG